MHVHSHDYHDIRHTLNSTPRPSMWCYVPRIWVRRRETSRECGQILEKPILRDPGAVSRVGRKGGAKVFITGERAPGTDSHWTFQTASSLPHLNYDLSKTEHSQGKFNIALADSNQNVFSTHRWFLCFCSCFWIKVSFVYTSLVNEPGNCGKTGTSSSRNSRKECRGNCLPIRHNKAFFVPNQEPVSAWIFRNSLVRVITQGLFRPYLNWKLSSRLFSRPNWLPLGLRG